MKVCGRYMLQLFHRLLVFRGLGCRHGFLLSPSPSSINALAVTENATIESEG